MYIFNALDVNNSLEIGGTFLDLSKAFDRHPCDGHRNRLKT